MEASIRAFVVTMFGTPTRIQPKQADRRKHQRVAVQIHGRYMLETRKEFPCQTVDMSPGGLALVGPVAGVIGERVIVYLDQVGRVEGKIARLIPNGFAMTLVATVRKRDKLAAQLTWLANRKILGLPEDRRHDRVQPSNPRTVLTLQDGRTIVARLIDVSTSGAGISSDLEFDMGTRLIVGRMHSTVVRKFDGGIAVEFARIVPSAEIDTEICVSV